MLDNSNGLSGFDTHIHGDGYLSEDSSSYRPPKKNSNDDADETIETRKAIWLAVIKNQGASKWTLC